MIIKDPVLISKEVIAVYEVDVGGVLIPVTYCYGDDAEGKGYWEYSLVPAYGNLDEEGIADLEEEFESVIEDIGL